VPETRDPAVEGKPAARSKKLLAENFRESAFCDEKSQPQSGTAIRHPPERVAVGPARTAHEDRRKRDAGAPAGSAITPDSSR